MLNSLKKNTFDFFDHEKMFRDLEKVSLLENRLFPQKPFLPGLQIEVSMLPAEKIGGDCYDILQVDDNKSLLYLSDVAGHGIPASLVVGIMNFVFYTLSHYTKDPKEILNQANRILKAKTREEVFVTTVMCNWDHEAQRFSYIQAGHEKIIHYKAKRKKAYLCSPGGVALGLVNDISVMLQEHELSLEKGDIVFLYSDGIIEASNSKNEFFGLHRLLKVVEKTATVSNLSYMNDAIIDEVKCFDSGGKQKDDMTVITMRKN